MPNNNKEFLCTKKHITFMMENCNNKGQFTMKKTFGFYFGQISDAAGEQMLGDMKPFDSAIIGEVDMSSAEYAGLTVEEACRRRLHAELQTRKHGSWGRLSDYLVNFTYASADVNTDKDHQDNKIHAYLRELGYFQHKNVANDRHYEVLDLGPNGASIFKNAVDAVFKNSTTRITFIPRPNQLRFVDAFMMYYNQYKNARNRAERRFLMFAICRLGKTATTLYTCERMNFKKILVLSAKCDTANSWFDDHIKWDFMKDYSWCDKNAIKDDPTCLDQKNVVCWLSFQSAAKYDSHDDAFDDVSYDDEAWQQYVLAQKWDIVIIDECHFGVDTNRNQPFLDMLDTKFMLELSATPYAKINRGEYTSKNSWCYTLLDEFLECRGNRDFVPFRVWHLTFEQMLSTMPKQKQIEQQKQALAACYDGDTLKWSWDAFFDKYAAPGWLFDELYTRFISAHGKHTMVYVHEKKHGDKLAKGLAGLGEYEVLNLCGKDYKGSDLQLSNEMSNSDKPYIIISCGKKFTGTTLKPIENIVFMGQVNSAERFIQFGCRAKNYFEGRTNPCNVWDLNPQCFLYSDTFKNLIDNEAKYRNRNKKDIIHAYEDCMELFELNGLEMKKATDFVSTFEQQMYVGVNDQAPAITDAILTGDTFDMLLKTGLLDKLDKTVIKAKMAVSDIPLDKPKDGNRIKGKKGGAHKVNLIKEISTIRMLLRDAFNRLPTFMKYNGLATVDDLFNYDSKEDLVYWNNLPIECITLLKDNLDEYDWYEFCNAIENAVKRTPAISCRSEWKNDCVNRPANVMY